MGPKPHYRKNKEYESTLHKWRVAFGYGVHELAREMGCHQLTISNLANGTVSPLYESKNKQGQIKPIVKKLCDFFGVEAAELFPRYFCSIDTKELSEEQIANITTGAHSLRNEDPAKALEIKEEINLVSNKYNRIKTKNKQVIIYRMLLGMTLKECATACCVSRQRAQQAETTVLNVLRNGKGI